MLMEHDCEAAGSTVADCELCMTLFWLGVMLRPEVEIIPFHTGVGWSENDLHRTLTVILDLYTIECRARGFPPFNYRSLGG